MTNAGREEICQEISGWIDGVRKMHDRQRPHRRRCKISLDEGYRLYCKTFINKITIILFDCAYDNGQESKFPGIILFK